MDVTKILAEGFVALRGITETGRTLNAKVDGEARDDVEEMLEKLEQVQYVLISLQEELMVLPAFLWVHVKLPAVE